MSMTALALRLAARETLRGRTWAGPDVVIGGGLVYDDGTDRPRFCITVDIEHGREPREATIVLGLSMMVRYAVDVEVEIEPGQHQTQRVPQLGIASATGATDLVLDAFAQQVLAAVDRDDDGWSEALRALAKSSADDVIRVRHLRGEDPSLAQRRICLDVTVPPLPAGVAKAAGGWRRFLQELDATAGLEAEAALVRDCVDRRTDEPDWLKLGIDIGEPAASFALPEPPALEAAPAAAKPKRQPKQKPKRETAAR